VGLDFWGGGRREKRRNGHIIKKISISIMTYNLEKRRKRENTHDRE
jgi:hypothetical protein